VASIFATADLVKALDRFYAKEDQALPIWLAIRLVKLDQAAWLSQVNNRRYNGFWGSTMAAGAGEPVSLDLMRPRSR